MSILMIPPPKRASRRLFTHLGALCFTLALTAGAHAQSLWSNPATWGGSVPVAGQNVVIPTGQTVLLDVDTASLGNLEINGTLRFDQKNLNLTAKHVVVHHGLLEIGTEAAPYAHKANITLTGMNRADDYLIHGDSTGTKGLIAIHGGRIEIHGARRSALAWTKLSATANPGATSITVVNPVNWRVGDKFVIAPSGFNPLEAEERTITGVSGSTITFTPALTFKHWGTLQTIEGRSVDQRAEVGLLTRDIVIQGDSNSASDNFGGHTMIHHEGWARIEGAEFVNMGQLRKQGRYAMHWHFAGDGTGQYIKNCSVRNSFHRAIATHQTDNVLVENNVAYNVLSHMYIPAEDGVELGNTYRGNLGVLSIRIASADFAFPSSSPGRSLQSEERAALFWFQHPNNRLEGNAIAGQTSGHGYFYDIGRTRYVTGADADFYNNVVHTIVGPREADYNYGPNMRGAGLFVDDYNPKPVAIPQVFEKLIAYKCVVSGAWTEQDEQILVDAVISDCGAGVLTNRGEVHDSVIIGATANNIGGAPLDLGPEHKRGGVHIFRAQGGRKTPNLKDVVVIDMPDGGLVWLDNIVNSGASLERCTYIRTSPPVYFKNPYTTGSTFTEPGGFLMDKDGTSSAQTTPQRLVMNSHPLTNSSSIHVPAMNGYRHPMVNSTITIVDNPAATLTGTWTTATTPTGFQGTNYLHDGNTGKGSKTASFPLSVGTSTWYKVDARWVAATDRADNTLMTIAGGTGQATPAEYSVNQKVSGGTWVPLDSFRFASGTTPKVLVSNTGSNGFVVADAVRYTMLVPQP